MFSLIGAWTNSWANNRDVIFAKVLGRAFWLHPLLTLVRGAIIDMVLTVTHGGRGEKHGTDIDLFKSNTLHALIGDGHSYLTHVFNLFRHHEHVKSRRCFGSGYFGAAYILHAMIMIISGMIWYSIMVAIFICTPFWNCRHIGIAAIFYLISYFWVFFKSRY